VSQITNTCGIKSNSTSLSCITLIMMWFLKLRFDQNSIIINHKLNNDLKSQIIIRLTQDKLLALLVR
jgi:hypothetical protein